jgi:preprotein translocase subunit SecE
VAREAGTRLSREVTVAEAKDMDNSGVGGVVGWVPRKLAELKAFFSEVKSELKKVTWPGKQEVYATTIVVLVTTFFFGFYLYGLDLLFSRAASLILK